VAAVALGFDPAVLADEQRVHHALDAGGRDAVLVDVAQDVGGELPLGVVTAVFQLGAERLDPEGLDALDRVLVDFAGEDSPADRLLLAGFVEAGDGLESQPHLRVRLPEDGRDLEGAFALSFDQGVRVHADIPDIFGDREQVILRVADLAAATRLLLEHAAGLQGFRAQTRGVDPMQPHQPRDHGQEAEGNGPCQQTVARSPGVG
jgi:hypothetical protein